MAGKFADRVPRCMRHLLRKCRKLPEAARVAQPQTAALEGSSVMAARKKKTTKAKRGKKKAASKVKVPKRRVTRGDRDAGHWD